MLWEADQSRKDNVSKRKAGRKAVLRTNKALGEEGTQAPGSKRFYQPAGWAPSKPWRAPPLLFRL